MIPREILKKIRQIELRTNRLVTGSAAGGCVRRTSRSTPESSGAPTNHHALRLGLRPQPLSVWGIQSVFLSALTCVLSPRRGFHSVTSLVCPIARPNSPAAGIVKEAASISPSPWGEGRDEGGRSNCLPIIPFTAAQPNGAANRFVRAGFGDRKSVV